MRIKRVLRWAILPVLLAGVAEVGLRLLGLGNPVMQTGDKDCGYLFQPNQQSLRFFCTNHINAFSQRSDDVTAEKPAGTFRILMIGDSVLYGTTYVDQAKIFSSLIQKDLTEKLHQPVQVLNASEGGWATGNELGYLESRGTFGADLVVFVNNTGDFDDVFNDKHVERETKPFCAISECWTRYMYPRLVHAMPQKDLGSVALGTGKEVYEKMDDVLSNIGKAKAFSNRHGAGFVELFSPALGDAWDNAGYQFGYGKLKAFAVANDIPMVDLTSTYKQFPYKQVYDSGNIHLNPFGHTLVAAEFEKALPEMRAAAERQMEHKSVATAAP